MSDLLERVRTNAQAHGLFREGESVLVAVSGGVDSMVLLAVLSRLAPERHWRLVVAHFNHQLRGRSSDADERLVKETASKLGLRCVTGRAEVRRHARDYKLSIEMAARELRHRFLAKTARKLRLRTVALAHHADDQVELFLLRLLRGAGADGLAGMKWRGPSPADSRIMLVRPLLGESKQALGEWARREGIAFREDATNAKFDVLRNRIRHELLPLLTRDYQPAIHKVLLRQAELLGSESEFVAEAAERWLAARRRTKFDLLPTALKRRVIQLQLGRLGVSASFDLIEQLRREAVVPVTVGPRLRVIREPNGTVRSRLVEKSHFRAEKGAIRLEGRAGEFTFAKLEIRWKYEALTAGRREAPKKVVNSEQFDADRVGNVIRLRHWRPGDRFQPIGMAQAVKLQDLFVNQKIPRAARKDLVVAATGSGEIFWVEGLRMAERFKLDKTTRRGLKWTWKRV